MKYDRTPAELRAIPNWLVWDLVQITGEKKLRKIPSYVNGALRSGTQGSPEDRAQLATFEEAVAASVNHTGIGFALLPDCGIVALDFDDCVVDGKVDPRVMEVVAGTYAESSPSGNGVRGFVRGNARSRNGNDGDPKVEVFGDSGFVTVTGNQLPEHDLIGWDDVIPMTEVCREFLADRFGEPAAGDDFAALKPRLDLTPEQIQRALASLPKDMHYNDWIKVGQACHHQGVDFEVWHAWSKGSPKYTTRDYCWERWRSFGRNRGPSITFATVLKMAGPPAYEDLVDRSDTGNANLLRQTTAGNLRYVPEHKSFMFWDGSQHVMDLHGSHAYAQALGVSKHYQGRADELDKLAAACNDAAERKRIEKAASGSREWAKHCRNRRGLEAMLALFAKDPRVVIGADLLDRQPHLLGVANGVVDLRTGELRAAGRDDYVTKRSRFAYRPGAQAPRWRAFVDEVTSTPGGAPRGRYAGYMQRLAGYLATGETREHKMFIPVGGGSNGKNILLDALQGVLGDYATTIAPAALMTTKHDANAESPSPTTASLAGKRAAISSESRDGQKLDVALIKRHTGGGFMTARFLQGNTFCFEITHKLVLMTNHRPQIDHLDGAMRGRLHMLPFDRTWNRPGVPDPDPNLPNGDKDLARKLAAESEGILAWVVEGAVAYYRDGLEPPTEVQEATRDFFSEADTLGQWLEGCERCDPRAGLRASEAHRHFTQWCAVAGAHVPSLKAFSNELCRRGVTSVKTSAGVNLGIHLADLF